jgi:hypothetical protein
MVLQKWWRWLSWSCRWRWWWWWWLWKVSVNCKFYFGAARITDSHVLRRTRWTDSICYTKAGVDCKSPLLIIQMWFNSAGDDGGDGSVYCIPNDFKGPRSAGIHTTHPIRCLFWSVLQMMITQTYTHTHTKTQTQTQTQTHTNTHNRWFHGYVRSSIPE